MFCTAMRVDLRQAVDLLEQGEVVAVPTETVYGLAASFDSEKAIKQVFALKNRPADHPLIVHIAELSWLNQLAKEIPLYVDKLIKAFWPGPLTLVLAKQVNVSELITAGQQTVALRMPAHPLFLSLLKALGKPVVAPSANKFCQTSPTTVEHVEKGMGEALPVLDGGRCQVGIESTIVLVTESNETILLRPGAITQQMIENVTGIPCLLRKDHTVKTPGNHKVHYQPKKPLFIISENSKLTEYLTKIQNRCYCMVLTFQPVPKGSLLITMPNNPADYAKELYHHWQKVADLPIDKVLIELPPNEPEWYAVRDRILKASSGTI